MIAAEGHAYRRFWIVLTTPTKPKRAPKSESEIAILAIERQINGGQQLSTPKETP